jgi:polar amino acid transport system permease protein
MESIPETSRTEVSRPTGGTLAGIDISRIPWWALILLAAGLILTYLIFADEQYADTFNYLKDGLVVTIRITLFSFTISIVVGLLLGMMRTSKNVILFNFATLYVEIIRGIPMIVLILYVAFVVVELGEGLVNALGNWGLALQTPALMVIFQPLADFQSRDVSFEVRAILALGLGYGAYEAEVFRAGIQSISRGQIEAARSLGMNYFQTMRFVVLPQAIRRVLPPLGNDLISLLKDSALATVLAVNELTQLGRKRRSSTFRALETFNVLVYLYLAMTLILSAGVRILENRMKFEE